MTAAKSLPLYLKRGTLLFLVWLAGIFMPCELGAEEPPVDSGNKINKIIVDAGHGGKDPGALGKNAKEKDIALKIALKLGKLIEENITDVEVIYTRKDDTYPTLKERTILANQEKADLFISIHVNASTRTSAQGTSTHIMGINQSDDNLDVAIRENSVIMMEDDWETKYEGFNPSSVESYVIFSVMQNVFEKQSIEMASYVQSQFRERAMRKDRGVIRQPLYVLAYSSMPGILIETGFISNPEEEKYLMSEYGQEIIASAIYRAFKEYKNSIEEKSHFERKLAPELAAPVVTTEEDLRENDQPAQNDEVKFLVQVASSKNLVELEPAAFKGYENLSVYESGRWYKYAVGKEMSYHEALDMCQDVKTDFPGAFVIAVKNGKIVPIAEAIKEINR